MRWLRELRAWWHARPLIRRCRYCGGTDGVNGCYACWGRTSRPSTQQESGRVRGDANRRLVWAKMSPAMNADHAARDLLWLADGLPPESEARKNIGPTAEVVLGALLDEIEERIQWVREQLSVHNEPTDA